MPTYIAILISGLIASTVAIVSLMVTVRSNRENTRKSQTISLMMQYHWDKDYIASREAFKECRDTNTLMNYAEHSEIRAKILQTLNHYEILAIGINNRVLSNQIYRDYFRSRLVADYDKCKPFIDKAREESGNEKIWREFERLACSWRHAS